MSALAPSRDEIFLVLKSVLSEHFGLRPEQIVPEARARLSLRLAPGETLALYTDGVTETRNAQGEMLGEERLVEVLDACVDEHAAKTADQLVQAAVDHAEFAPADDIAILVIRHL